MKRYEEEQKMENDRKRLRTLGHAQNDQNRQDRNGVKEREEWSE